MDYMLDPPDDDYDDDSPCTLCDGSCYDDEPEYDDEASANASSNWQNARGF